ncbi:hypothetical protein MKW92_011327 [Papaver armeniacum]|nr:hypothetical protein MKW92_011327 [Papaver armeniacum]
MAQAERLGLRMQKELKLLLSDPPSGVSFPMVSADPSELPTSSSSSSSSSSLSTINAMMEGPEGSVYAKGVFSIQIQIPDRYPFQPPNVTFLTPIYHPNIDNGGRICLDILNLPPKGAWQPSLNIYTVITSIRLLLSEPNPDDGLMCEASREYKYNRQIFDQKARSMTERYAKAGGVIGGSSGGGNTPKENPSMIGTEGVNLDSRSVENDARNIENEKKTSCKTLGVRRKLSLETSVAAQVSNSDDKVNVPHKHKLSLSLSQSLSSGSSSKLLAVGQDDNHLEQPSHQVHPSILVNESIIGSSQKLSVTKRKFKDDDVKESTALHRDSSISHSEIPSNPPTKSHWPQVTDHVEQRPEQGSESKIEDALANVSSNKKQRKLKKMLPVEVSSSPQNSNADGMEDLLSSSYRTTLGSLDTNSSNTLMPTSDEFEEQQTYQGHGAGSGTKSGTSSQRRFGRKLSLGMAGLTKKDNFDNKENIPPNQNSSSTDPKSLCIGSSAKSPNHLLENKTVTKKQQKEDLPNAEAVVVLDSEDSEEEGKSLKRSRLSLSRNVWWEKAEVAMNMNPLRLCFLNVNSVFRLFLSLF